MSSASPIVPLLEAACGEAGALPDALRRFDERAAGDGGVDDFEWSVRVNDTLSCFGATYYFDTGHAKGASHADVNTRFDAIARGFGVTRSTGLDALLCADLADEDDVMQIVLGVDARAALEQTRLKYYFILRGDPHSTVTRIARAFDVELPSTINTSLTTIVGIDFSTSGLMDLKLYFALDSSRITSVLRTTSDVARLVRASRVITLQHCLLRPRRQLYFHADGPHALQGELERLVSHQPATAELGRHVRRARAAGFAVEPWILSHPFADASLTRSTFNAYFHLPATR